MPSPRVGNIERQDSESEHIGPDYTGDNISAKKSANYVWNSGSSLWERMTQPGSSGGGTQYADGVARGTATGTIVMGDDGTLIQAITAKTLGTQVVSADTGLVVNAAIHGLTTAGGGGYVDVKVNPSGALTADVSGSTLAANSGVDIGDVTINNAVGAAAVNIQDGGNSITVDGTVAVSGSVAVTGPLTDTQLRATPVPVSLTSTTVTGTVTTKETRSATNTTATVAASATVVTLIASNANRLGATIYNDSSAILYIKLGATASTSDFTVALSPLTSSIGGYFEVPFAYTGIITGIWASATGNARVGEIV